MELCIAMGPAEAAPAWLEPLLSTRFFAACAAHPASPRNECNMFCLCCRETPAALCYYCRTQRHASHRVLQIRRSSYHDVVRVAEVEDVLDITGVQTYVINSARVLFLNERPQPRGAGAATGKAAASPYNCEVCARSLLDDFRFCSLGCKLVSIKSKREKLSVVGKYERDEETNVGSSCSDNRSKNEGSSTNVDGSGGGGDKPAAAKPRHRRKGIPVRAPFY